MQSRFKKSQSKIPGRSASLGSRFIRGLGPPRIRGRRDTVAAADLPKPEKSGFTTKDRVTVLISLLALSISGLSSYFTFFRDETEISASILGVSGLGSEEEQEPTTVSVALMNTGNRQIALLNADIYLVQVGNDEWLRQELQPVDDAADTSPKTLLEPGKMAVVTVKGESNWKGILSYRMAVPPGDDHDYRTIMGVRLAVLGSNGSRIHGNLDSIELQFRGSEFSGRATDGSAVTFAAKDRGALASWWHQLRDDYKF